MFLVTHINKSLASVSGFSDLFSFSFIGPNCNSAVLSVWSFTRVTRTSVIEPSDAFSGSGIESYGVRPPTEDAAMPRCGWTRGL